MWTIGVLSKRTGCHVETIRYYERIGLPPSSPRSHGGHRLYDTDHLRRLVFVRRGRDLGFSREEIREPLSGRRRWRRLPSGARPYAGADRRGAGQVAELRRIERTLVEMAALCDDDQRCDRPIIDRLFEASAAAH